MTLIASFKELLLLSQYSSSGFVCKSDRISGFRWAVLGYCHVSLGWSRAHQPPCVPLPDVCLPKGWQRALSPAQVSPYPLLRGSTESGRCVPPGLYLRQFSPNHASAAGSGFARGTASAIGCLPVQPLSHYGDVFSYHASCRRELKQSTPQSFVLHISGGDAP